jgi:hypothetical protein
MTTTLIELSVAEKAQLEAFSGQIAYSADRDR